jgi:GT2 family glycosyltransferase
VRHVLALVPAAAEVLILDQTPEHPLEISQLLQSWHDEQVIRWLRIDAPSIPGAMNKALLEAKCEIILFLDDDVVPEAGLLEAHEAAHACADPAIVAGRVIQPWQEGLKVVQGGRFHFASLQSAWANEFMAGNFSIDLETALRVGGFDERFVRVAYNFESEFAHRLRRANCAIFYEPNACVHHLRIAEGGTRVFGDHLTSFSPNHAVGAYYCILRTWSGWRSIMLFIARPFRSIITRHHLRQPWWIPATLVAELLGMMWAVALALRGPRYLMMRNEDVAVK